MPNTTYAPESWTVTPTQFSWHDKGGRSIDLSTDDNGELEVYVEDGTDDFETRGWCAFHIAKPDVPDFLLLLQGWIENLG